MPCEDEDNQHCATTWTRPQDAIHNAVCQNNTAPPPPEPIVVPGDV